MSQATITKACIHNFFRLGIWGPLDQGRYELDSGTHEFGFKFDNNPPHHTLCLEESHGSGLFLIKELSDWLQGFIKLAMRRIPFLTPRIQFLEDVKRKFNNLSKCTKSNDKLKAPSNLRFEPVQGKFSSI